MWRDIGPRRSPCIGCVRSHIPCMIPKRTEGPAKNPLYHIGTWEGASAVLACFEHVARPLAPADHRLLTIKNSRGDLAGFAARFTDTNRDDLLLHTQELPTLGVVASFPLSGSLP